MVNVCESIFGSVSLSGLDTRPQQGSSALAYVMKSTYRGLPSWASVLTFAPGVVRGPFEALESFRVVVIPAKRRDATLLSALMLSLELKKLV